MLRLCLLLALLTSPAWQTADPDYEWSFPRDHWSHRDYQIEWWYFTGHLESNEAPVRSFGYQFTIFRIGLTTVSNRLDSAWDSSSLLMGHAAVTDKDRGEHLFSELLFRETELLAGFGEHPDAVIAWSRGPVGTAGRWELRWNGEAFDFSMVDERQGLAFELSTKPSKPRVFQGPNGLSRKSDAPGAASQYYSFTRLVTEGTLSLDGRSRRVRGQSWMDQEFSSSQLTEQQVGWDWFSLQLDDGSELMLFALRRADGSIDHRRGTIIPTAGGPRYLEGQSWSTRVTRNWTSPQTGVTYPTEWVVELPGVGLRLRATADVEDQENRSELSAAPKYWEGAVTVSDEEGRRIGRGYVELTGYGEGNRPPI